MRLIENVWFNNHNAKYWLVPLLLPATCLFYVISMLRRLAFKFGIIKSFKVSKPVVVVGNIGVGGNGKTPVVVHLVALAKSLGFTPGVISRGYGGVATHYPYVLNESSTSAEAGDEPVLIFQRCHVPVVVGADRVANAQQLVKLGCDLILSDDGLQHYKLQRDLELVIVDGKRLFGNGLLLPAGPLREGVWRLSNADLVIFNGGKADENSLTKERSLLMQLAATELINICNGDQVSVSDFLTNNKSVNAAAGIGDPQRFFDTLKILGFEIAMQQGFVDHKKFTFADFSAFNTDLPLLMTEKDAVKCKQFAQKNWWYLPVNASFCEQDSQILKEKLQGLAKR